jgi:hypothetical protein
MRPIIFLGLGALVGFGAPPLGFAQNGSLGGGGGTLAVSQTGNPPMASGAGTLTLGQPGGSNANGGALQGGVGTLAISQTGNSPIASGAGTLTLGQPGGSNANGATLDLGPTGSSPKVSGKGSLATGGTGTYTRKKLPGKMKSGTLKLNQGVVKGSVIGNPSNGGGSGTLAISQTGNSPVANGAGTLTLGQPGGSNANGAALDLGPTGSPSQGGTLTLGGPSNGNDVMKTHKKSKTTPAANGIQGKSGQQQAVVVGPSGEEIHTDKYGRIKNYPGIDNRTEKSKRKKLPGKIKSGQPYLQTNMKNVSASGQTLQSNSQGVSGTAKEKNLPDRMKSGQLNSGALKGFSKAEMGGSGGTGNLPPGSK